MNETISHYRLLRKIGAGGMGEVWLAEDTRLDRRVALKLLPGDLREDVKRRKRFLAEARAASALSHPNVCTVFEVGEDEAGHLFIALEYLEGPTLDSVLRQSPLDVPRAVDIARQVAEALSAAHAKGIVHRDIKPSNISVGARGHVKVLDFGLAKRLVEEDAGFASSSLTASGDILGTPAYMSPEQARGRTVDHRTDIFSLGAVIYEILTGRPPFSGSTFGEVIHRVVNESPPAIARLNYDVPAELEHITLKCIQKEPDRRYQSADELRIDLENLAAGLAEDRARRPARTAVASGPPEFPGLTARVGPCVDTVASPASPDPEELESCDVFINCASVDDQPALPGKPGWVSQLRRNLGLRMEQLSGEPVKVAAWPAPGDTSAVDARVLDSLAKIKAMVSVVSPPFVKSEICRRGFETFWQKAEGEGRLWVDDKSRIVKAVKTPVPQSEVPPGLSALLSRLVEFEFYEEDPETGRLRQFDEALGPTAQQRFLERVYDLAQDLCQVLRARALPGRLAGAEAKTIYLAEATSDIRAERERVRRELTERGHHVVPSAPLPTVAEELESAVRGLLESSHVAVHLVGSRYGLVPENGTESFTEVQMRLAAQAASAPPLRRLIWIPPGVEAADHRQAEFLRRLRETSDFLHGAEIIEGAINELKDVLLAALERPARKAPAATPGSTPLVYLVADVADEAAVEPLEDFLFDAGLEVRTPDFESEEAEAALAHVENLRECDAVVVYYGSVRRSWVEAQLRNLAKAFGHGRSRPFLAQAVWLAPPLDRRKERFRTHAAEILAQPGDAFSASPELESVVRRIHEGAAQGGGG